MIMVNLTASIEQYRYRAPPTPVRTAELSGGVAQQGGLSTARSTDNRQDQRLRAVEKVRD
jgi:hypothetical protein